MGPYCRWVCMAEGCLTSDLYCPNGMWLNKISYSCCTVRDFIYLLTYTVLIEAAQSCYWLFGVVRIPFFYILIDASFEFSERRIGLPIVYPKVLLFSQWKSVSSFVCYICSTVWFFFFLTVKVHILCSVLNIVQAVHFKGWKYESTWSPKVKVCLLTWQG